MTIPRIALDTETAEGNVPFIATTCDSMLETRLWDIKNRWRDFQELKYICESKDVIKTCHALTYDKYALSLVGIQVKPPYDCTLIAASLLNENFAPRKLKTMAAKYLDEPCLEDKELKKIKAKFKREAKKEGRQFYYDQIPANILYPYAKQDAVYTIRLWYMFEEELKKYKDLYNLEKRLVPIIVAMQQRGFKVNREYLREACIQGHKLSVKLDGQLRDYLRDHTNFDEEYIKIAKFKGPQLINMFSALHIEIKDRTKKRGNVATDAKALKKVKDHAFVDLILKDRDIDKQLSTYWDPLYKRYTTDERPYAHFLFWQSGAKSGRFSAELIQTAPKKAKEGAKFHVRKAFIPRRGRRFVFADYSQIEYRLFAHFSNNVKLMSDIKQGLDVHLATAYALFGKDVVEESKDSKKKYRDRAKTINFGIIYGMGPDKLAGSLGLPLTEAYQVLQDYYKVYPVQEYMQSEVDSLYKTGVVKIDFNSSLMSFTRDYRVPLGFAYRATNIKIQGTAAYVMKYAMFRCTKWLKDNQIDAPMLITIHDEFGWEVKDDDNWEWTAKNLQEQMEDRVTFKVPLTVEVKTSTVSWGDAKEIAFK